VLFCFVYFFEGWVLLVIVVSIVRESFYLQIGTQFCYNFGVFVETAFRKRLFFCEVSIPVLRELLDEVKQVIGHVSRGKTLLLVW